MNSVENIRAIVTDIEGTTSSLSFVKDILFPYARKHLPFYVRKNEKGVTGILNDVRALENKPQMTTDAVIDTLVRWIDEDRKATPLKTLQGMIWEDGYKAQDFQGHIYNDALEALQRWHARGLKLYIYSSGSIPAQKLLFTHTPYGNLTRLFSGYFDTTMGAKIEAESYNKIAKVIGLPLAAILFLSDSTSEIDAAKQAGMRVILVDRDGRTPNSVKDFEQIRLQEKVA